jgi:NAD+ synthase
LRHCRSRTLQIDAAAVAARIEAGIRDVVCGQLRRKGVVLGLSGGIDSSVVGALAARALGGDRVIGLMMPELTRRPSSAELATALAETFGIRTFTEDITGMLTAAAVTGGVTMRFGRSCRSTARGIGARSCLPDIIRQRATPVFSIVVRTPTGEERRMRIPIDAYLGIVAAPTSSSGFAR